VGHGEDAVPIGGRFVEEIFLAAFPVSAGGAIFGPLIEDGLESGLSVVPAALLEESTRFAKPIQARTSIC